MTKDIVPWKCHICNGEFDTPDGGICSRCNCATCRDHLHQIGAKKLEATWACKDCLTNEEKSNLMINGAFESEKISKGTKIFALVSAWLLITAVLYLKWSNLAPEQSYLYFLYPFFAAYVIAGAWYQGWYLVTFKNTVGRPKFFFTIFVEIALLVLTIMAAEKGNEGIRLILLFLLFSILHVGLVVGLYRNAKKQINEPTTASTATRQKGGA